MKYKAELEPAVPASFLSVGVGVCQFQSDRTSDWWKASPPERGPEGCGGGER